MPADSERPHDTVRKEHQAFARKLHQIEKDARMLLKGQDPTVQNLVHGIRRDSERATRLKKKLLALATMFDRARRMEETGPWEATPAIQGAMFFLFDCLKASDPEQKWYAPEKIGRPRFVINIVGLQIPMHAATLPAADRERVPRQANEDLDVLLLQQPQLPANFVADEAARCGLGKVRLGECAPATPAERSYPGKAAHRNDKNKGATKRKRDAQREPVEISDSDEDDEVEIVDEPVPARKRTRSQTKAAAALPKGKGKASISARPGSARGRRARKAATPPATEEEERSGVESEDDEDDEVEVVDVVSEPAPSRKRTRSVARATPSASKGKGKARTPASGRRFRKTAPPPEPEAEESSSVESEDDTSAPPAFRPLARLRLAWDQHPRDASGERIPYVETEEEVAERRQLEFLASRPSPFYGLNGELMGHVSPPSSAGTPSLSEQAEEAEAALAREDANTIRIKEEVRAFNEQRVLAGGDDDDAPEWPGSDGLVSQPEWTLLPDAGVDDDSAEEMSDPDEEEEDELAVVTELLRSSPSPSRPVTPWRFPTPDWMKEGPPSTRPAELQ